MKLHQYDKKVWDDGDANHTWQFGIIKNRSLLWVNYQNPTSEFYLSGGLRVLLLFSKSSPFGLEFQTNCWSLSFHFFTEYFKGWDT